MSNQITIGLIVKGNIYKTNEYVIVTKCRHDNDAQLPTLSLVHYHCPDTLSLYISWSSHNTIKEINKEEINKYQTNRLAPHPDYETIGRTPSQKLTHSSLTHTHTDRTV